MEVGTHGARGQGLSQSIAPDAANGPQCAGIWDGRPKGSWVVGVRIIQCRFGVLDVVSARYCFKTGGLYVSGSSRCRRSGSSASFVALRLVGWLLTGGPSVCVSSAPIVQLTGLPVEQWFRKPSDAVPFQRQLLLVEVLRKACGAVV